MAHIVDFRQRPLSLMNLMRSGKYVGGHSYWKLYVIENIFRIIIHSVLTPEIPQGWWAVAVDQSIRGKAERFKTNYLKKAWHGKPGGHNIYYIDLRDLNEIIRANANLFSPVIPDIDKWMIGIEDLRLPRNVVAHMNCPSSNDFRRIDVFHSDCETLLEAVKSQIPLLIP